MLVVVTKIPKLKSYILPQDLKYLNSFLMIKITESFSSKEYLTAIDPNKKEYKLTYNKIK